ncbi:hypothetical protein ABTM84_19135, partial [Acinetobacter baumannii]
MTAEDLHKQQKNFMRGSFLFLALAILTICYLAYLWYKANWLVLIAGFIVFILFMIQAYFYSFWCFQIRKQQLGCTFTAWINWL